jgi:cyclophilin family peptidyl-prolyl cis-trans isomerase
MDYKKLVEENTKDLDFANKKYIIKLATSQGDILLELMPEKAPGHCRNMIGLARAGFYKGLIFHRIIPGFMIQGGCPQGTGTGWPGFQIDAEFNDMPHVEGVLSMARSQDPNSAGSQFFICLGPHSHLDGSYTAFGKTVDEESISVVRQIGATPTDGSDRPHEDVLINQCEVLEESLV